MIDQRTEKAPRTSRAEGRQENPHGQGSQSDKASQFSSVSLPKGGGAIRGIGEKFAANPVTGAGSMTVPIAVSPGRSGFAPQLSLSYDSGSGNGPFGLGWSLSLPAITRKTDKGLPKYQDADESDVFILSGAEDLVPILDGAGQILKTEQDGYRIRSCRPRIEGLFARIERWTRITDGDTHWRSISNSGAVSFTMLHHVPSAALQDRLLAEVHRVLKPGGVFAGSDSRWSVGFHLIHLRDTMVIVEPETFAARLEAAGFTDVSVKVAKQAFRFRARRP
jgi:SAM-dependent methyltransferase